MRKYKVHIGRDALGRLLKLWAFSLPRKVKKSRPSLLKRILIKLSSKVNILIRTNITSAFQAISSDITELYYKTGKCYLCVHKDVFGQEVYGFQVSGIADTSMVVKSFQKAMKKIKKYLVKIPKDLIIHQDQGSQYTSYRYVNEVLKTCSISYSCKGTPTDNPGQESFFGRFKEEWADEIAELKNPDEVKSFVKKKIHYYNKERLHTSIQLITPYEFTRNYILKLRNILVQKR
jgi:putative transposase